MTRYRLHIAGAPTRRTSPPEAYFSWQQGWQWLEEEYTPVYRMTGYVEVTGEFVPCQRPSEMHAEHERRLKAGEPVGLQCLRKAWRVAA